MIDCKITNNKISFINNNSILNKSVLIITGQHGDEHTPLKVGIDLINHLKDNTTDVNWDLYSQITIFNGVNINALKMGTRYVKPDENELYDFNRLYKSYIPNNIDPTEIKQFADVNDLIIDIHSSPHVLTPFVALDNDCPFSRNLSSFCDTHNIRYTVFPTNNNNTLKQYCLHKNILGDHEYVGFGSNNKNIKVAFTVETSGLNNIIEDDNACLNLVMTIINNAGQIGFGKSDKNVQQTHVLTSDCSGVYIKSNYSNFYKKDDIIGSIYNLSGEKIKDIKSDITGYVIQSICSQYISENQWISTIQQTSE